MPPERGYDEGMNVLRVFTGLQIGGLIVAGLGALAFVSYGYQCKYLGFVPPGLLAATIGTVGHFFAWLIRRKRPETIAKRPNQPPAL
jgi:hypothetical protein